MLNTFLLLQMMANNEIVIIDSSDDEGPPSKIKCLDTDVVIIEDEDESTVNGNDTKVIKNGSTTNPIKEKVPVIKVKRVDLVPVNINNKEKIHSNLYEELVINNVTTESSTNNTENQNDINEFEAFLEACSNCNCDQKYKNIIMKKIADIKLKYSKADSSFIKSKHFKKYLLSSTKKIQEKPKNVIIVFNEIYKELDAKREKKVELSERERCHLDKLYYTQKKVYRKIKLLENKEVDFDDDNNSSYIMLERYKERLCNIHKKICSFTKDNFYAGRQLYRKLDFTFSNYKEINQAIEKFYNKKKQFPSLYEVDQCIRKCEKNHQLNLSEDVLKSEIKSTYHELCKILQSRRKQELYDSLHSFVETGNDDPAENDPEFNALLQQRHVEYEKNIETLMQKFTDYQEQGKDPIISSDSSDSNEVSEDSAS